MIRGSLAAVLLLLLGISLSGCGTSTAAERMPAAVTVDTAALRCPELDARDVAEWQKTVARPPAWQKRGAQLGELMAHVDHLEVAVQRKNFTGARIAAEYQSCRHADGKKVS